MGNVSKDVSVEHLLQLKRSLEKRVAIEVQRAMAEFESAAGFTPSAIDVHLVPVHPMGQLMPDYVVDHVTAQLDVLK